MSTGTSIDWTMKASRKTARARPLSAANAANSAFHKPVAVAVGPSGVRGDQQPGRRGIVVSAAGLPPTAERGDSERGRVVADPAVDPAGVRGHVVDPIRDHGLRLWADEEAVALDLDGLPDRSPFLPGHGQQPQLFRLLRVHADHRLARCLVLLDLRVDITELGVRSKCWSPSRDLTVPCRLNACAFNSRPTVGAVTRCPCRDSSRPGAAVTSSSSAVGTSDRRARPVRPAPSALGSGAGQRPRPAFAHHQGGGRVPRAVARPGFDLEYALTDGRLADPGCSRDQAHASVAQQSGLGRQRQPLLTLVQMKEVGGLPYFTVSARTG